MRRSLEMERWQRALSGRGTEVRAARRLRISRPFLGLSLSAGLLALLAWGCAQEMSGDPTEVPAVSNLPLALDVEEVFPRGDVVAVLGEEVRFEVRLGPEHDPARMRYRWFLDEERLSRGGASLDLRTGNLKEGVHWVRLALSDSHQEGSILWKLQVLSNPHRNREPWILQAFPPVGRAVVKGECAEFAVAAYDPDAGDELRYTWLLNGALLAQAQLGAQRVEIDTASLALGAHFVDVFVTDGVLRPELPRTRYRWHLDVVAEAESDRLPAHFGGAWPIGNLRLERGGRLRLEVSAEAPNPEDRPAFRWEVDGVLQGSEDPFFVLEHGSEDGETGPLVRKVSCWLQSSEDRNADRLRAVEWTVTFGRSEPESEDPLASGGQPRVEVRGPQPSVFMDPGCPVLFRVDAEDPDGDVLTYRWSVNGIPMPGGGPVFLYVPGMEAVWDEPDPSLGFQRAQVEVEVDDGVGESSPVLRRWNVPAAATGEQGSAAGVTPRPGAIILDNGAPGTVAKGAWQPSGASGFYGTDSLYSKTAGDTYTYRCSLASPGRYEVLLWWTVWASRSPAVPVTIKHAAGTATRTVNQTANGGCWNSLGEYEFSSTAEIVITAAGGNYSTCADAACLSPLASSSSSPSQTEVIIDDGSSGTSSVGTWSVSSGPNPYNGRSLYAKGSGSYTFRRAISSPGTYDAYAWWTVVSSRESAVPYDVTHSGGVSTVYKDQRVDGGKWVLLGRYAFSTELKVTVRVPGSASVCADAVRFVLVEAASPPPSNPSPTPGEIILDNGMPGTTAVGTWSVSGGPNPYGADSLYAKNSGSYRYEIALPAAGLYGVWVWYTEWPSRESAVPYTVEHAQGTAVLYMDQRTNGGAWRPLGDYQFGQTARITVSVVDGDTVCADAVRLVPGGGSPTPTSPTPPAQTSPTAAEILDLAAFALTPGMARVSWRTTFLGNSTVEYGSTTSLGSVQTVSGSRAYHSVLLKSLSANTLYYVRVKSANGFVSKTSSVVSFRTPTATPSFTVRSSHPRLFFTDTEVAAIRQRITVAPFSTWWSSLRSFVGTQITKTLSTVQGEDSDNEVAAAFYGLIADDSNARRHAINMAVGVANLAATGDRNALKWRIDLMAPIYDWLYAYTTSGEKSAIRDALMQCARNLEGLVRADEYAVGHSSGNQSSVLLAALAVYGEHADAAGFLTRAMQRYQEGFWSFWREHGGENGGSYKGSWYTTVATEYNLRAITAWKSATGQNLFASETWFGKLAPWYAYSLMPNMFFMPHGDIYFSNGATDAERYIFLNIAREYRNSEAQWLADKVRGYLPVWGPRAVWDILWYDPSVPSTKPSAPYCRHFRGPGMVFFQDAYAEDAVCASFRAPRYYMNSHTHLDHCTFTIFFRKPLALDSGLYDQYDGSHWRNYYSRTIAHNGILVHDPSEVFLRYKEQVAPDGGQKFFTPPDDCPAAYPRTIAELVDADYFFLGGIAAFEDTDLYAYAVADGKRAYNSKKLSTFYRHFLWLKSIPAWSRPAIAVFDEVESTNANFKKTYLLHTQMKPLVSGTQVSATHGTGMLYQRTVFPASASISLVGGAGMEYWVAGKNYPPTRPPKEGEYSGAWRVEVSPSAARTRDEFLHVLYPAASGSSAPPAIRAIDAVSMKGFETGNLVVLFAIKCGTMTSAKYSVSASRKHLLFGLAPCKAYDVLVGGTRVASAESSANGTLVVDTGAGTVEILAK